MSDLAHMDPCPSGTVRRLPVTGALSRSLDDMDARTISDAVGHHLETP